MYSSTYHEVLSKLEEAHYSLINTPRKIALEWQIVNKIEELIELLLKNKAILINNEGKIK